MNHVNVTKMTKDLHKRDADKLSFWQAVAKLIGLSKKEREQGLDARDTRNRRVLRTRVNEIKRNSPLEN